MTRGIRLDKVPAARRIVDGEELHELMPLDQKALIEQPSLPGPVIERGRGYEHEVVDAVALAVLRAVAVISQRGDDQRQPLAALAPVEVFQPELPAGPVFQQSDQ